MTVDERIEDAHRRSVVLYRRLCDLEAQRQQVQASVAAVQQELLLIDGEVRALDALKRDVG